MNGFPRAKKHGSSKFACAPSAGSVPHRYRRPSARVLQPPAARHALSEQASGEVKSKPPPAREVLVRHICAILENHPLTGITLGLAGYLLVGFRLKQPSSSLAQQQQLATVAGSSIEESTCHVAMLQHSTRTRSHSRQSNAHKWLSCQARAQGMRIQLQIAQLH